MGLNRSRCFEVWVLAPVQNDAVVGEGKSVLGYVVELSGLPDSRTNLCQDTLSELDQCPFLSGMRSCHVSSGISR